MKLHPCLLLVPIIVALTGPAAGQQNSPSASIQVFTNVRLVYGNGEVAEPATLVIRDDVILEAGPRSAVPVPEDAEVHNLPGRTIMPALVNTHAHLGWEAYGDWGSRFFTDDNLIDHLYRHAYYGVGTIISTGSDKEDVARRVKLEQLKGNVGGARYHLSPGMGTPGGGPNPRFTDDPDYWGVHAISEPEQATRTVSELADGGYDIAKIWVDGRDTRRGAQIKLAPEVYQAVLQAAYDHDMRIIAHATTLADHKNLVRAGNRRFIHMPYDVPVDNEYLDLVTANNVFIVPTLGMITKGEPYYIPAFQDPFFFDQVPESTLSSLNAGYAAPPETRTEAQRRRSAMLADNFFRLREHVILGTDAGAVGDFFGYADHVELSLFVRMGMTPMEAIVAATSRSATAFGLDNVGELLPGKAADFIVLNANPLDDINNTREIDVVYLRGVQLDREELREKWTQEQ